MPTQSHRRTKEGDSATVSSADLATYLLQQRNNDRLITEADRVFSGLDIDGALHHLQSIMFAPEDQPPGNGFRAILVTPYNRTDKGDIVYEETLFSPRPNDAKETLTREKNRVLSQAKYRFVEVGIDIRWSTLTAEPYDDTQQQITANISSFRLGFHMSGNIVIASAQGETLVNPQDINRKKLIKLLIGATKTPFFDISTNLYPRETMEEALQNGWRRVDEVLARKEDDQPSVE